MTKNLFEISECMDFTFDSNCGFHCRPVWPGNFLEMSAVEKFFRILGCLESFDKELSDRRKCAQSHSGSKNSVTYPVVSMIFSSSVLLALSNPKTALLFLEVPSNSGIEKEKYLGIRLIFKQTTTYSSFIITSIPSCRGNWCCQLLKLLGFLFGGTDQVNAQLSSLLGAVESLIFLPKKSFLNHLPTSYKLFFLFLLSFSVLTNLCLKKILLIVVLEGFGKRKKVNICLKGYINPEFLRLLKHVLHLCICSAYNVI